MQVQHTIKPGRPLPSAAIVMAAEERPLEGPVLEKAERCFKQARHNLRMLYIPEIGAAILAAYLVGRFAAPEGVGGAFVWYAGSLALVAAAFAFMRTFFPNTAKIRADIEEGMVQVYRCQVKSATQDFGPQSTRLHYRLSLSGLQASILVTDENVGPGSRVVVYRLPLSELVIRVVVTPLEG